MTTPVTATKGNSLDRKPLKRALKTVIGRLKCGSSQLIASGRVGGEGSVFFKGLNPGSVSMLQRGYRQHKLNLVYFFFFCCGSGGVTKGGSGCVG